MRYRPLVVLVCCAACLVPFVYARAQATPASSDTQNNSGTLSPLDLMMDSDSYVPPFYTGRALPSAGSTIRLQAVPYFKQANGSLIPNSAITFTWKQDDRIVGNLSGLGHNTVTLPAAILYGTSEIEVDAYASDGSRYGVATISVPSEPVQLILYEDNPLLGIEYNHPVSTGASVPESEMTFAVVPYFATVRGPNDSRLRYSWTVNDSAVAATAGDPSELTLNSKGYNGQASIGLSLMQSDNIYFSPTGTWDVSLGPASSGYSASGSGAKNPFTGQSQ